MFSKTSNANTHRTSKQRRKRRQRLGGAYSEAGTDYSMTSSANFRNEGLTTLDDRFDKVRSPAYPCLSTHGERSPWISFPPSTCTYRPCLFHFPLPPPFLILPIIARCIPDPNTLDPRILQRRRSRRRRRTIRLVRPPFLESSPPIQRIQTIRRNNG